MTVMATYRVAGMTCGHCVHAVSEEVAAIDGVKDVEVELRPGAESAVRVVSEDALPDEAVAAAIDEAGYEFHGAA